MSLEELLVTDEIKEMAKGKDLELTVTIDQCSYRNACLDLLIVENGAREKVRGINSCPRKRTMSDSALVMKSNGDIVTQQHSELSVAAEEKRRELLEEELIQKGLLQEREEYEFRQFEANRYVSEYLEKLELGSVSAESGYKTESLSEDSSELDTELRESYEIGECKVADLPDNLLKRLCDCLATDKIVMNEFFDAFGLPADITKGTISNRFRADEIPIRSRLFFILKKYSATPTQLLRDVCNSLLDEASLVKSLDEAVLSYRPLHPLSLVRPLEAVRKLHVGRLQRKAVTYIQRGRILIVKVPEYRSNYELECFFKDLDPTSEIITLEVDKDDIIKGLWRTVHSWQHNRDAFSFIAIFWLVVPSKQSTQMLKARGNLEKLVSKCSQIKIIVTMSEELSGHDFDEAIVVYVRPGLAIYPFVVTGIISTFRQHRRHKDLLLLMKEYKRKYYYSKFIEITSTLSSSVIFKSARS